LKDKKIKRRKDRGMKRWKKKDGNTILFFARTLIGLYFLTSAAKKILTQTLDSSREF